MLDSVIKKFNVAADSRLTHSMNDDWQQCLACGHRCKIPPGRSGICQVRFNDQGKLWVPRGYVAGLQVDPIEKKPFFHVYPGSPTLSFGMLGCDYHCSYCQNWSTSQAVRDPLAVAGVEPMDPQTLVRMAREAGAPVLTSTYNEPLITSEWAVEIFTAARRSGLQCAFVSNGNATPEVLDFLQPWVQFYKVDLKGFRDREYRKLGGKLETVTRTIASLVEREFWVEVVTLLVPGWNDSREEMRDLARFLASVSVDIPWHVTAFHPDYKMTDRSATQAGTLEEAWNLGKEAGLHHVYAGNRPGAVGERESTFCPGCGSCLVRRQGFQVLENRLSSGHCPDCGRRIPGHWNSE